MIDIKDIEHLEFYASLDIRYRDHNGLPSSLYPYTYAARGYEFQPLTVYNTAVVNRAKLVKGRPHVLLLADWCEMEGPGFGVTVSAKTIISRIRKGWTFADAISYGPHERPECRTRFTSKYVIDGETRTFMEWCELNRISPYTVGARMNKEGMSFEDALKTPLKKTGPKPKLYTAYGESHTINEWARICKIQPQTLRQRIYSHWEIEEALSTPMVKRRRLDHPPRAEEEDGGITVPPSSL